VARLGLLGFVTAALLLLLTSVGAGRADAQEDDDQRFDNAYCLSCHSAEGMETSLPSGDILNLTVDPQEWAMSVHGEYEIPCALCHTDITPFPHEPIAEPDLRSYKIAKNVACADCHEEQATAAADNVHATALAAGNLEAAVCTDCHGAHNTSSPEPRSPEIPLTCRTCHSEIYDVYLESVHGQALVDGNPDVPTCTDCHGVHDIEGPSLPEFHLFSPDICAECHADDDLMDRYDISTNVFESYVADFHGTTVVLFEALAPGQETNKAVCVDCHGIHNMQSADNPDSPTFTENLLGTCQRCHPNATENFPSAWLSHYEPKFGTATLVWAVTWFYRIVIPLLIGAMVAYVIIAFSRRFGKGAERG
jgi:cytochrome c553